MVAMFAVGMQFPVYLDLNGWIAVVMVYLVFAGAMPIQTLKQPRDYLTSIMMIVMIVCAVLGIVVLGAKGKATITAPVFTGFTSASGMMFPVLFVSVACGALSGFHSLVSSGTSSKMVENEADAVKVGYGAMVVESFVGILAIIIAGIMFSDMNTAGTVPSTAALPPPRSRSLPPASPAVCRRSASTGHRGHGVHDHERFRPRPDLPRRGCPHRPHFLLRVLRREQRRSGR